MVAFTMDPADLAELGSRLPENVRALERRNNPMLATTYRGVPIPPRCLGIAGERLSKGDPIVLGKDGLIYKTQGRSV